MSKPATTRTREPLKGEHYFAPDRLTGKSAPTIWIVCNPEWPKGTEPYLEKCPGCDECPSDD